MNTNAYPTAMQPYLPFIIAIVALVVLTLIVLCIRYAVRDRRKRELLSSKPLGLPEEQIDMASMARRRRPTREVFRFPAGAVTDAVVNEWADLTAPRLGHGFQPIEVRVIPQRLWYPAMYEVTFAKLEDLR